MLLNKGSVGTGRTVVDFPGGVTMGPLRLAPPCGPPGVDAGG